MRNIYNNILKISIPVFILITLNGCSNLNYEEDGIYTENILPDYTKNSIKENIKSNIRREDAIKKALEVLNDGFKENLDRQSLSEYVSLANINGGEFCWQINFTEDIDEQKEGNFYYVSIDAQHGYVREVIINKYKKEDIGDVENDIPITEDEIRSMIKTLTNALNINVDTNILNINKGDEIFTNKNVVQVVDLEEKELKYEFIVDINTKRITAYYKER